MKINIEEKYINNLSTKYDVTNREQFEKDYTSKERNMWLFVAYNIKDRPEKVIYDSVLDKDFLNKILQIHLLSTKLEPFTIDEWFNYLNSK